MTAPTELPPEEQTILPDRADHAMVIDLLEVLRRRGQEVPATGARLVSADGTKQIVLPDELHEALARAAEALARGYAVTIAPKNTMLTTQQAADLLSVSRPTLTKLLDEGKIPYERPNSHRRIRLSDVLAYQRRSREESHAALDELTRLSVEMDLYETPPPTES
jgi:excisionase family DNA binding protein